MPAKAILVALFLLSLAVVVVVCLEALPQRVNADMAAPDEILVAATALSSGSLLRNKDVEWHPATGKPEPGQIRRPPGAATNGNGNTDLDQQPPSEVYGAALRVSLAAGEPIRRSAIVKPGDRGFLQIVLWPGARAIAIPVATGGASTSLLSPGDRVDVILTQTFNNDPPLARRSVSETVVEGLRVLAIDAVDGKSTGATSGFGRTVTLEVTPQQAEKISVATELGKLSLVLRSTSAGGPPGPFLQASANSASVTPVWAGDVSPALEDMPLSRAKAAFQPVVEVLHGVKSVPVKIQ
jgi:pilus assembly protein CpaB